MPEFLNITDELLKKKLLIEVKQERTSTLGVCQEDRYRVLPVYILKFSNALFYSDNNYWAT